MEILEATFRAFDSVVNSPFAAVAASGLSAGATYWLRTEFSRSTARKHIVAVAIETQRNLAKIASEKEYILPEFGLSINQGDFEVEKFQNKIYPIIEAAFSRRIDALCEIAESQGLDPVILPLIRTYKDHVLLLMEDTIVRQRKSQKYWDNYAASKKSLHRLLRALGYYKSIETILKCADAEAEVDTSKPPNALGYSNSFPLHKISR